MNNDVQAARSPLDQTHFDVIVVGGSFAGLSAALQIVRARRRVLVIDAGKPRNRFAESAHGFLGQDGQAPKQIVQTGREQLLKYPTAQFVKGEATRAERRSNGSFLVEMDSGAIYQSDRIILAMGVVDHLPDLPGLVERWGKTVNQCPYCHGYELAGKRWGVLNTGEASLHQTKIMPDWSEDVVFFSNGVDQFSANNRASLIARGIMVEDTPVKALVGEPERLSGVKLQDGRLIPIEAMFLITRTSISSSLVSQLGCELEEGPFGLIVKTNNLQETTVEGVFAAGDIARPIHNATWAAADGVSAGIFAHQSLMVHRNPYHR